MSHREQDAYSGSLLEEFRERVGVDKWGRTPVQAAKDRGQKYHMQETTVQIGAGGRLHLLEARLEAIERGCYYYRGLDPESVAQNTRIAYYEGQIEEISGKWQDAEELAKHNTEDAILCAMQRDQFEKAYKEQADTIASLRERLDNCRVLIKDMETTEQVQLKSARGEIEQLKAIIAQKNRELEIAINRTTWASQCTLEEYTQMEENAKLGALVRQMPDGGYLIRLDGKVHACCNGEVDGSKVWIEEAGKVVENG